MAAEPPANQYAHILLAARGIADRRGDDPEPRIEVPEAAACGGIVREQHALRGALENEIARRREYLAVPDRLAWHAPGRPLADRIPCEQRSLAVFWPFGDQKH